jgi:hypothetical protein
MPLSTEGLIEGMKRFRADKLALVALVGSMGVESESDALDRLREIIRISSERLVAIRRMPRAKRREHRREEAIWHDVWELASDIEPWLAKVVGAGEGSRPSSPVAPDGPV